ncbi:MULTISPECIES: calcium-binding protein [Aeromicrobium]|uniref:calcium-binding protein n=1 Tax=Aeromicrobium TaxID=2040 RepID=UPI00257BBF10|nr:MULTISPECIES: calcium-binding protein [Aeromicrobium]
MNHPHHRLVLASGAALALGLAVSTSGVAHAAGAPSTLRQPTDDTFLTAGSGVANSYTVLASGTSTLVTFKDASGAPFSVPAGTPLCGTSADVTLCQVTSGSVIIDARDGNDSVSVTVSMPVVLAGNTGDDLLRSVGTSKSTFMGGAGNDTVSYAGVTKSVSAAIGSSAGISGGMSGSINADVENLLGGSAADVLIGGAHPLGRVDGAAGDDTLGGGPNGSALVGGTGNDQLLARGPNNYFEGGPGNDHLVGGSGVDWFFAKDGAAGDRITCGGGDDWVSADPGDTIVDPQNCETIS